MWYVYVLLSEASGRSYTGFTNHVERRLIEHNVTEAKVFTLRHRPWTLIRTESKSEAMKRERFLKSGVGRTQLKEFVAQFISRPHFGAVSAFGAKGLKILLRVRPWRIGGFPMHRDHTPPASGIPEDFLLEIIVSAVSRFFGTTHHTPLGNSRGVFIENTCIGCFPIHRDHTPPIPGIGSFFYVACVCVVI
jgi:putative endonuclease